MHSLLIVDDQRDLAVLLDYFFTVCGYTVTMATSGPQALELAQAKDFDLALVDWQMPDLDGLTVCRSLLQEAEIQHKRIGVWLMTGAATDSVAVSAALAGVRGVLSKPLNPPQIVELFEDYLVSRT